MTQHECSIAYNTTIKKKNKKAKLSWTPHNVPVLRPYRYKLVGF